jgi:S1-C subfamily serine protease
VPLALLSLSFGGSSLPTKSIQPLQDGSGDTICTTFSINQQEGYWATAAHCLIDDSDIPAPLTVHPVKIHGKDAILVFIDPALDIAVVQSSEHAPTIPKGYQPVVDDKIMVYGYMFGGPSPTLFHGVIANLDLQDIMVLDMRIGPGHSGSPILDSAYHVVSIGRVVAFGFSGGALYSSLDDLMPYWGE